MWVLSVWGLVWGVWGPYVGVECMGLYGGYGGLMWVLSVWGLVWGVWGPYVGVKCMGACMGALCGC